jgi:hypothetical protein
MVGRAIWQEAMALPDPAAREQFLATTGASRLRILTAIADAYATPWTTRFGDTRQGPAAHDGWYTQYAE